MKRHLTRLLPATIVCTALTTGVCAVPSFASNTANYYTPCTDVTGTISAEVQRGGQRLGAGLNVETGDTVTYALTFRNNNPAGAGEDKTYYLADDPEVNGATDTHLWGKFVGSEDGKSLQNDHNSILKPNTGFKAHVTDAHLKDTSQAQEFVVTDADIKKGTFTTTFTLPISENPSGGARCSVQLTSTIQTKRAQTPAPAPGKPSNPVPPTSAPPSTSLPAPAPKPGTKPTQPSDPTEKPGTPDTQNQSAPELWKIIAGVISAVVAVLGLAAALGPHVPRLVAEVQKLLRR